MSISIERKYTARDHSESPNAGWSFQTYLTKSDVLFGLIDGLEKVVEDGRSNKTDLFLLINGKVKRAEVKCLNCQSATRKTNAQYNSGNGFELRTDIPVYEQLRNYLCKADLYIVAEEEDGNHEDANITVMSRKEAFEYYRVRLSFKKGCGNVPDRIRFAHGGVLKESRIAQRLNTIEKNGYIL